MSDELLQLKSRIEKLNKQHQIEILKIFLKHDIEITENKNGTFINLTYLKKRPINEINKYLKYIEEQEKLLSEAENLKNEIKLSIN